MQEVLGFLAEIGFTPPGLTLDGVIHRFDRNGKGNGWYIGWQNHAVKSGKVYYVLDVGDWKTREKHEFRPDASTISKADKAAIEKQIQEAKARAAEDKRMRHEDAAAKAEKYWSTALETGESEYLDRKRLVTPMGARFYKGVLQVPMHSAEGKLWGLQRIFPDGTKRFMTGQRVESCFHLIGAETLASVSEAFMVEGFATGGSVHMATGKPTIVAFDAGNLVAVAKAVKSKYPDLSITIAGDDDRFGEQNAGREKGEKAALMGHASLIFPAFESDEGKPTDFNDLHVREGLEQVRAQLTAETDPLVGYLPLGYDEGTHFFYVLDRKDITRLSVFSEVQMFSLARKEYWAEKYALANGSTDWARAKDETLALSHKVGPFDATRVRGTGVWLDGDHVVINTGRSLIVDGKDTPMTAMRSRFIYVQTKNRMPPLHDKPLTVEECKTVLDACSSLRWRQDQNAALLAGWLAIARIAGALPIRPHVWLTGGSGTGKSTVMDRIIAPCLGSPKGKLYVQGGSTEAGIRQEIKSSSVPLIFDEFETTGEATKEKIAALVELLRNSWSATQGAVLKGSAGGNSVHYQLAFAALVSSIRVNLANDADRSRFTVLELAPHGSDGSQWKVLQAALDAIDTELGERLFARSAGMVNVIRGSARVIGTALAGVISQRYGQQVGTLLAGWWSLNSDEVIDEETARKLVADLDVDEGKRASEDADEHQCLHRLLTWKVSLRNGECNADDTIGSVLARGDKTWWNALKTYGIVVNGEGFYVANNHSELAKIYATSQWTEWRRSLERLKGTKPNVQKWMSGKNERSIFIPWEAAGMGPIKDDGLLGAC